MGCMFSESQPESESDLKISLYDQLGADAIEQVVVVFYIKVLENPELAPFFTDTSMPILETHQKRFLQYVLGGPNNYKGRSIYAAHAGARANGLNEKHFNLVGKCLIDTLKEFKLSKKQIDGIMNIVSSVKDHVLGISK